MVGFNIELALGLGTMAGMAVAASQPCDLLSAAGTPCVAAHSSVRALFGAFAGALYQVTRNSDNNVTDISPLSTGGVANATAQDSFCANTTCLITTIYDQTGNANHLTAAPAGGETAGPVTGGGDNTAGAVGAPVTVNGTKAYGVFISPGTGYRIDKTVGVATGNKPQGIYAVFDGTHYNDACCMDYGNAEANNDNDGDGTMQAIYFGSCTVWGSGQGSGPWIMGDLENGLFAQSSTAVNTNDPSQTSRFVTAIVKGTSKNHWEIRGGDAQSGNLTTYFTGTRPSGYSPMDMQGSIILGIGGDNSDGAQGTFYEGAMTATYPSNATDNSIQQNIVSAGYAVTSLVSGPTVAVGSKVTFRCTTPGYTTRYLWQNGSAIDTKVIKSSSTKAHRQQGSFKVVQGLGNAGCVSFESVYTPGSYIRHSSFELYVNAPDGSQLFEDDATFCPMAALNGQGNSIRSWSYPTRFWRHYDNVVYIASEGGPEVFDNTASYNNDVSFVVGSGFIA